MHKSGTLLLFKTFKNLNNEKKLFTYQEKCDKIDLIKVLLKSTFIIPKTKEKSMVNGMNLLAAEPSVGFVCLLGVGVVFCGLISIIGIVSLMNFLCSRGSNTKQANEKQLQPNSVSPMQEKKSAPVTINNRGEIIAAVCAAVAEENGTDISAIRVISFKKIN